MSPTTAPARHPVITAWSAVSPFGLGRAAFGEGLAARRRTVTALDPGAGPTPHPEACLVPDFDPRQVLGRKGTRSMDRVTGLAVAAAGSLLEDEPRNREVGTGERAAFVLGTTTGSAQSMMDFTRDSLTGERPFFVDPARFPNTVMNCAAGQSAIWHRIKGPNTTLAGGRAAGLHALTYSRRLLNAGRARAVLCGSAEEFTPARAWLEHRAQEDGTGQVLGEGGAIMLLEAPGGTGQPVLAEVLAVELGVPPAVDGPVTEPVRTVLAGCLRRALDRAGAGADAVAAVARCGAPGAWGTAEEEAVQEVLGAAGPADPRLPELIGDTGAAATGFQIAALLEHAARDRDAAGRLGVTTAVDPAGTVGCAVIRLH